MARRRREPGTDREPSPTPDGVGRRSQGEGGTGWFYGSVTRRLKPHWPSVPWTDFGGAERGTGRGWNVLRRNHGTAGCLPPATSPALRRTPGSRLGNEPRGPPPRPRRLPDGAAARPTWAADQDVRRRRPPEPGRGPAPRHQLERHEPRVLRGEQDGARIRIPQRPDPRRSRAGRQSSLRRRGNSAHRRGVYRVGVGILSLKPAWMPAVATCGFHCLTVASGTPNQLAMLHSASPERTV